MAEDMPQRAPCPCGEESVLKAYDLRTTYNGETCLIRDVPAYECINNHIRFDRLTRIQIKERLKEAHDRNMQGIDFEHQT